MHEKDEYTDEEARKIAEEEYLRERQEAYETEDPDGDLYDFDSPLANEILSNFDDVED